MDLASLDVVRSEDAHAAAERRLVQVCRVLVLLVEDQELSHDTVDVDVEWMIGAPVVVQDFKGKSESFLCHLELASHVVCLHQDRLELDCLGVHAQLAVLQLL